MNQLSRFFGVNKYLAFFINTHQMYFTSLPDHNKPGFDEQLHFSSFKKHNIVFNALAGSSHCENHVGCLSFKTVLSGEEWYGIDKRRVAVRPGQFLILNDHQTYSSSIDAIGKVRSLSIFFREEFAFSVFFDKLYNENISLDNPFYNEGLVPEFFQTLNYTDPGLLKQLSGLIFSLDSQGYSSSLLDEHLVVILQYLIGTYKAESQRVMGVNALKAATRTEIYKRLCVARDFMHSCFADKLDLQAISHEACLSVPQLVRQFKIVFRATPHQYLARIRLEYAAGLLTDTTRPIHEITWMCGFENMSAFCRAFRAEYNVQPHNFRVMS
jgi:AraC family transcriptional regulator